MVSIPFTHSSRIKAFTLLEISVVLILISLITGGGLVMLTASVKQTQNNVTVARMQAIETALLNFSVANGRIPCPSDLTQLPTSAYYGVEAGANTPGITSSTTPSSGVGNGVCSGTLSVTISGTPTSETVTPAANFTSSSYAAEGGVPTRALRLPDDTMYDGWGRRFRYAVDTSKTATGMLPVASSCASGVAITVNDATGAPRSSGALYAILSHGANGHGGYTASGVPINAGSANADELTNCHCSSAAIAGTYTGTYVQKMMTTDASNALDNFDDIVTYKEAWQMQTQNTLPPTPPPTIYFTDYYNYRIRKVNGCGIITTIAGNGTQGYSGDGGLATSAELNNPYSVAVDSSGNIYIADPITNRVRMVTASTGIITTVAGTGTQGYSGNGGLATSAELHGPSGVAMDSSGNLYILDGGNIRIREVTASTGIITTVAGNGYYPYGPVGGPATDAGLQTPTDVAVDSSGNLYISNIGSGEVGNCIYKVTASTGIITVVAGGCMTMANFSGDGGPATGATLFRPDGVAVDSSGNIYIADTQNCRIRKVTASTGIITTVAGNGTLGYSGDGGPATSAELNWPQGVAVDSSGNIYIADFFNNRIRKVTASTGIITTVAGNGTGGYSGDGGPATSAELYQAYGIVVVDR